MNYQPNQYNSYIQRADEVRALYTARDRKRERQELWAKIFILLVLPATLAVILHLKW